MKIWITDRTRPPIGFIFQDVKEENTMAKSAVVSKAANPIARTSAGLRDAIFDEIDSIRSGESNPTRANAVAKLASGIVETVRMEIEVQRHLRRVNVKADNNTGLGAPLSLGA